MPSLIISPRFSDDSISVRAAAIKARWTVHRLNSWSDVHAIQFEEPISAYGESLFVAYVAEQLGLELIEPPFSILTSIPPHFINRKIHFATFKEGKRIREQKFIKPADDKAFKAKVYGSGAELPGFDVVHQDTPVLISDPVWWLYEIRGFILNGEVKTLSVYSRNHELNKNDEQAWSATNEEISSALDYYSVLLKEIRNIIPPSVVIDIGYIKDVGLSVVEFNPAFASGIYGCNPTHVLPVISRCFITQKNISPEDSKWVIKRTDPNSHL